MGQPRPTRRMYGYFADNELLPREIRGHNLFFSTEDGWLYCTSAAKAVRLSEAEQLVPRGLVVKEEQVLGASKAPVELKAGKPGARNKGMVAVLTVGCILMLLANIWVVLFQR